MSLSDMLKRITRQKDGYPVPAGSIRDLIVAARKIKTDKEAIQFLWDHTAKEEHYNFLMDLINATAMIESMLIDKTPENLPEKKNTPEKKSMVSIPQDQIAPKSVVTCPKCGSSNIELKGEIQMPGYQIREYHCPSCDYTFEKLVYGDVEKGENLKAGSLKGGPSEPFTKDPPGEGGRFDKCVQEMMSEGKTKESAEKICGAIARAKFGNKGP